MLLVGSKSQLVKKRLRLFIRFIFYYIQWPNIKLHWTSWSLFCKVSALVGIQT